MLYKLAKKSSNWILKNILRRRAFFRHKKSHEACYKANKLKKSCFARKQKRLAVGKKIVKQDKSLKIRSLLNKKQIDKSWLHGVADRNRKIKSSLYNKNA